MALREVLAQLDIEVRGLGSLQAADASVAKYAQGMRPAATETERFRIKQVELAETAQRVAQKIRQLQKAEGDQSAKISELRLAHQRLTAESKRYGAQADKLTATTTAQTGSFSGMVSGLSGAFAALGAMVAATAGIRSALTTVAEAIGAVVEQGSAIDDTAQRLNLSARALQEWQFVALETGVSADALERSLVVLGRNAAGPAAARLRDLGVATTDASGALRSQEAIFSDTITALSEMENPTERAAAAQAAFGKSGTELLTLVNAGPKGIERLRERFVELGGGLSDDVVGGAADAGDAIDDFRTSVATLRSVLVADLLPAVAWLAAGIATVVGGMSQLIRHSSVMETIFGGMASAIVGFAVLTAPVWLITGAALAAVVAAFGLLFLAVEDVVSAFRGGKSVFGEVVEALLGGVGVTMTFGGAIDQLGLKWQEMGVGALATFADIRAAVDSVRVGLGLMTPEAALQDAGAARADAVNAARNLNKSRAVAAGAEATRMIERSIPAPAEVVARKAAGGRARGGSGGKMSVQAPVTIHVNGAQDPQAVAREVERHHARRIREAADTLPSGEED